VFNFGVELVPALCTSRKILQNIPTKVVCCQQFFYSRATLFLVEDLKSLVMPKETTPFYFDSNWLLEGILIIILH